MIHRRISLFALLAVTLISLGGVARAQTVANGPYYATPSWDQTLPVAQRFIVLANMSQQAVLDRETGLVWERSPDVFPHDWGTAQTHCIIRETGGRKGWRLPSIPELASLVDPSVSPFNPPALPPGHPFIGVQNRNYWSATTSFSPGGGVAAWTVYFGNGGLSPVFKSNSTEVFTWCVRGGSGLDIPF